MSECGRLLYYVSAQSTTDGLRDDDTRSAVLTSFILCSTSPPTLDVRSWSLSNSRMGARFVYSLVMPLYSTDCIGVGRGDLDLLFSSICYWESSLVLLSVGDGDGSLSVLARRGTFN